MTVFHEAHACLINKISAFSPQSFGEKQGGVLSTVQSRRVELHELHVPQARTGPEGHSIPITRRHIRVRGVGEELPGPSRTRILTACSSHSPAPARKVSCSCSSGESMGPTAAAIPP